MRVRARRHQRAHRVRPAALVALVTAIALVAVVALVALLAMHRPRGRAVSAAVPVQSPAARSPDLPTAPAPSPAPRVSRGPFSAVLGLGDSVPSGAACDCTSFVTLLAQEQARTQQRSVTVRNLALNGLTSSGLLDQVRAQHLTAAPGAVTLVTIGANDLASAQLSTPGCRSLDDLVCYRPALLALATNVAEVLRLLTSGVTHGPILVTGYWNVFLDGPVGTAQGSDYVRDSAALTRKANAVLQHEARLAGVVYVDLLGPFLAAAGGSSDDEGPLLAADGDHPSAQGHAVIALALERAMALHHLP